MSLQVAKMRLFLVFDTEGNGVRTPIALYYKINDIIADPSTDGTVLAATDNGVKRVDIPQSHRISLNTCFTSINYMALEVMAFFGQFVQKNRMESP
jgi:hypothetical protein